MTRRSKWSAEKTISALQSFHRRRKRINSTYVRKYHEPLYCAGIRYFGSWNAALEAAGFLHAVTRRNKWSRVIIVEKIKKFLADHEPLHNNHIKSNHSILYTVSCQYFGSWGQAVEAAGVDYGSVLRVRLRKWSKEAVVAEISCRQKAGVSLSGVVVQVEDIGLYEAAMRYFGKQGWAEARKAAGLPARDPRPGIVYDGQVVIDGLQILYEEGHGIHAAAFIGSPYHNLHTAGIRIFGSHDKALIAAGFDPEHTRKQRRWTKQGILKDIRALEKVGVRLNWWSVGKSHPALCSVAVRLFGTWGQAVEAAGINYRKHLRQWSTKTWLRHMTQVAYEQILENKIIMRRQKTP